MKKISRRRFLAVSGKIALGSILFLALPIKLFIGKEKFNRFTLKLKEFVRSELYKKHNLAG